MKLNQHHREALLNELTKAKEDKELQNRCLEENKETNLVHWFEINSFLAEERIKLIEKSLVDNEIDF